MFGADKSALTIQDTECDGRAKTMQGGFYRRRIRLQLRAFSLLHSWIVLFVEVFAAWRTADGAGDSTSGDPTFAGRVRSTRWKRGNVHAISRRRTRGQQVHTTTRS